MSFSVLGTGKAVPEYVLTNDELSTIVETNDEWISTRTGIKRRHIMKDETMTELCVKAAKEALENAVKQFMFDLYNNSVQYLRDNHNNVVAEYTLRDMNKPMGVSEYRIKDYLPENLQNELPSIEELINSVHIIPPITKTINNHS